MPGADLLTDPARLNAIERLDLRAPDAYETFDRLARLASRLLHAPTGLVSIVTGEEQFFPGAVGLEEPWASARATPITHSYCQYVVVEQKPLIVGDARLHPVLKTSPALHEMDAMAYLGVPLITGEGHVLGSLCAIDGEPREWDAGDVDMLADLAESVMSEITYRASRQAIEHGVEALRRQSLIFRLLDDAAMVTDSARNIIEWNPAAERLFGIPRKDAIGKPTSIFQDQDYDLRGALIVQGLRSEGRWDGEVPFVRPNGERGLCATTILPLLDDRGREYGRLGIARDVTDRAKNEMAMQQAQRLESLGAMARGVGHDFNNLLTIIGGSAALLELSANIDDDDRESIHVITSAVRRASDITRNMLTYARGGEGDPVQTDIREVISDSLAIAQPVIPRGIRVETALPPAPLQVVCRPGQIHQVLLNLVLNACQAMGDTGTLRIYADHDAAQVRVGVADTGPGISQEHQGRLFEPFFTTKSERGGTGLGLASAAGIVAAHRGSIRVNSTPGAGAEFVVELPLVPA